MVFDRLAAGPGALSPGQHTEQLWRQSRGVPGQAVAEGAGAQGQLGHALQGAGGHCAELRASGSTDSKGER